MPVANRTRRSALLTLLFSFVLALAMTASASAGQYPPPPSDGTVAGFSVQKQSVAPGDTQRITVTGVLPGSTVTLTCQCPDGLGGTQVLSLKVVADANGQAVFVFQIPKGAADGTYAFNITGTDAAGQPFAVNGTFTVDASLPITGSQLTRGAGIAGAAIVAGAVMLLLARRRSSVRDETTV